MYLQLQYKIRTNNLQILEFLSKNIGYYTHLRCSMYFLEQDMPNNIDIFSLIFRYKLEDPSVIEKCRTAIKPMLLYFNWCLRVSFDNLHPYPLLLELIVIVQILLRKICYFSLLNMFSGNPPSDNINEFTK